MTEFSFMPGKSQAPDALVGFSGGREAEAVSDLQSFLPNTPKFPPSAAAPAAPPENQSLSWGDEFQEDRSLSWGDEFQETPDFATAPVSPGTQRAFRSARTSARNLEGGIRAAGFGVDVEEELADLQPSLTNTLINPTFDLLQIGVHTVAGAADELLETGNFGAALRQGAIEFYNALPGFTHDEARRLSSTDLLMEHTDVFSDTAAGRWGAMGLGLLMDVVLDPLTTPFMGLKVLNAGVGIAKTGRRLGGLGLGTGTVPLMNVAGQAAWAAGRDAGGVAKALDILARQNVPGAQRFGDSFIPDFDFKQAIIKADPADKKKLVDQFDQWKNQRVKTVADYNSQMTDLKTAAQDIKQGLTREEDVFFGLWLDQPDEQFAKAVTAATKVFTKREGVSSPQYYSELMDKAKKFRSHYLEMAQKETVESMGLWSADDMIANYTPGRTPTTPRSERFWRNVKEQSPEDRIAREQIEILRKMGVDMPANQGGLKGTEKLTPAQSKSFDTVQQRLAMSEPTELNASLAFIQRGIESVRAMTTRNFVLSVADDPLISRRIIDEASGEVINHGVDLTLSAVKKPGFQEDLVKRGYALIDLAAVKTYTKIPTGVAVDTGQKAIDDVLKPFELEEVVELGKSGGLHIMPTPVVKDLMKVDDLLSDHSSAGKLFQNFLKVSGVWKAYALFSPAYHMRNMYSNWFQNWLAGVTDDKLYLKSLALQNGGTDKLRSPIRQIVERRIGKLTMGKGSKWAEGDDIWFEEGATKLNGNEVKKLLDDHLINDSGLFAKDMFIDTERALLIDSERQVSRAAFQATTKVFSEVMEELEGTTYSMEHRRFIANIAEAEVKTRAMHQKISLDEAWTSKRFSVTQFDDIDAQNVDGAWLLQSGEKVHMDIINGPYGSRIEQAIDGAFRDNPMPTYNQLRGIPGLENIRQRDMAIFVDQFRSARTKGVSAGWHKRYAKETESLIGEANMPEFGMVFSIAKGNPAERLKETFGIMAAAREGTSVAHLPEQYKTLYKQGMTDLEKLASQRSRFFGFTPRDTNVNRFFSDKVHAPTDDSYRASSYMVRKMAEMDGISIEDAEEVVWSITNRTEDKIGAPSIAWDSAFEHAKEEITQFLTKFDGVHRPKDGFSIRRIMPKASGANASSSVASLGLLKEAKFISSIGLKATGDAGAFGVSGHSLNSAQQIEFGKTLLDSVTDTDGQQIKALKELDEMFGTHHYIRTHPALVNGSPEPTFHLVVEGGDERLTRFYGSILGDAFDQDQVRFITPTATGGNGDALLLRRESGAWSDEQIKDMMEKSLDDFDVNPDRQFLVLANHANDPDWHARVSRSIGDDTDIIPEHFRFNGEVVDNDDFGRILAETQGAVTYKGGPDILQRITRDLHESYVEAYERIGNRYGLRPLRGKDEVLNGGSRGLNRAGEINRRSSMQPEGDVSDLQRAPGDFLEQREIGPVGHKLLDNFDFADVDDEIGFILPDGRKIAYDSDLTHTGMIAKAKGERVVRDGRQVTEALEEGVVRVGGPGDYHLSGQPSSQQIREMVQYGEGVGSFYVDFGTMEGKVESKFFKTAAEMQRFFALKQTSLGKKKPRGVVKGAIDLTDEANAIIHLSQSADVSTMIHELGHLWRRGLNAKDAKVIEDWIGSSFKNWNVPNEETFARGFEKYMREGVSPSDDLGDLFDYGKVYMENIYATLRGSPLSDGAMSQEVKDVFGRILSGGSLDLNEITMKSLNTKASPQDVGDVFKMGMEVLERTLGTSSRHIKASRAFGTAMENNARGAHFLGIVSRTMREGADFDRAAIMARDSVDKYLFDYSRGLTNFEKNKVRPLIPFYSWMRFNIPLQIQAIFEDPARYSKIPKFIESIEAMTRDWQGIEAPDYTQELHAVRLPAIINSKPVLFNPNLPFQDINRMPLPQVSQSGSVGFPDVLSNLTPFVKLFGEMVPEKGYNTFLDAPIERYAGERSKNLHVPFLPDVGIGVTKKTEQAISSLFPLVGRVARFNIAHSESKEGDLSKGWNLTHLTGELLGIKLINVDTQNTIRGETFARRTALTALKKRLEDEHEIHINTRARKKTTRRGKRKKKARPKFGDTF